jgi:peptide-methionine (S)-S-oxide reductase
MTNAPMTIPDSHFVNGNPLQGPFDDTFRQAVFALGCFWGAERRFWEIDGVYSTAVGYAGGKIPNPTYQSVCNGETGHAEVVLVVYDPARVSYAELLKVFWESHNPTQGMRQGNDVGTQYRSAIYTCSDAQNEAADRSLAAYQSELTAAGHEQITTKIAPLDTFYYAEEYHQQYLAKNPGGYCGLAGTGVSCAPVV